MRINRKPPKKQALVRYENAKQKGAILYSAIKDKHDPRAIAAKKHMAHKAYGGVI